MTNQYRSLKKQFIDEDPRTQPYRPGPMADKGVQAIFFDFMGTCLDWHTSIIHALPESLSERNRSALALEWRQAFFDAIRSRPAGELPEDIDETHTRTLQEVLRRPANSEIAVRFRSENGNTEKAIRHAVQAWHSMAAWPDVKLEMERVRSECGCEMFVLANGTTRLQLDLVHSSKLDFDMLFSSELLGLAKPDPEVYRRAMQLIQAPNPDQVVMVAAHAYDLRAAKALGMKTVYIRRWTDDLDENIDQIREENDGNVLDSFDGLAECIKNLI